MADVTVAGLRAGFGGTAVLDGLDLHVPAGSLTAVLGPSGCGKSTLLRTIAGFHRAQRGRVRIDDRTVEGPGVHLRPERREVGIVPQEGALFPHLSVAGNVAFGLDATPGARSHVREMLDLVGLGGFGERMPQELSGGQQQRVALARALAPQPRLILLDEPFNSLDAGLRTQLREDVARVLRASAATALLVTHDQEEAMSMADAVAVLLGGRIAQSGSPREVYAQPADLDIALLLGDVVVLDARGAAGGLRLCGAGVECVPGASEQRAGEPGGQGPLAILRPEQLRVRGVTDTAVAPANAIVREIHVYGHEAAVLLEPAGAPADAPILSDGGRLRARVHGETGIRGDHPVRVDVHGHARLVGGSAVAEWLGGQARSQPRAAHPVASSGPAPGPAGGIVAR